MLLNVFIVLVVVLV